MLHLLGALGLSALPAFLLLWYFYRRDKARPEPLGLIGKSVLFGFLAVLPAAAIEYGLDLLPIPQTAFVQAFLVAATVEESVKLFFVKTYLFKRPEFDERADGIVYAICVSLGFAFVENFMYGYKDTGLLLLRGITAVPLHAVATGVMGYWLGMAKIEGQRDGRRGLAGAWKKGLAWAIFIHGSYDFFLFTGGLWSLCVFPLLLVGWVVLNRIYRKALAMDNADPRLSASQGQPGSLP
jgi:RsiW-degrading membrane proteinase PrsW (M82 family)